MRQPVQPKAMLRLILAAAFLCLLVPVACYADLYFPYVTTRNGWQTEIAVINTGGSNVACGLMALGQSGAAIDTMNITLPSHGRRQIDVAASFLNHTGIYYILCDSDSAAVQGYMKFYQSGVCRAALPAVSKVNISDTLYIPHIASNDSFWTGISLVNTTGQEKSLTIIFDDGTEQGIDLDANGHTSFTIYSLFNNQRQPGIKSARITNAADVIGLELCGGYRQIDGLILTGEPVSTIYYPHVADMTNWWTGIVAYNTSAVAGQITISPYSQAGTALASSTLPIQGGEKYVGVVKNLGLPNQTAWFKIDSTRPLVGFERFGHLDPYIYLLAAYAEVSGSGARAGVFPKIEKSGWTGIAFVNTEAGAAFVTLTAYNDNGNVVATRTIIVSGHAKVVNMAEKIFAPQNITSATYIAYSSNKTVVGFQLNGSSDRIMLDCLPALAGQAGNGSAPATFTNSLGMTFNLIPNGTFTMGSPTDEIGRNSDETQHQVTLTQSFYMQTTEVTQDQWQAVMGSNPSYFSSCGSNCPVEWVSWSDVQSFIAALNARGEGTYRLPTEAEWEYACRAGSTTAFANGPLTVVGCAYDAALDALGWYCYNSGGTTQPVAQKQANDWGLYDMHGNVWEWCADRYGDYPIGSVVDPTGPLTGDFMVARGGCSGCGAYLSRSAMRDFSLDRGTDNIGFRLVAPASQ